MIIENKLLLITIQIFHKLSRLTQINLLQQKNKKKILKNKKVNKIQIIIYKSHNLSKSLKTRNYITKNL